MSDRAGGMDERDVDERFASIISQWGSPLPTAQDVVDDLDDEDRADGAAPVPDPPDPTPAPDVVAGDVVVDPSPAGDEARRGDRDEAPSDAPEPARPSWVNPSPVDIVLPATSWRAAEPAPAPEEGHGAGSDSDDDHFDPPAVQLPPQEDLHFWGAVIGLVAGPLMLLYVAMARPFHSTRWFLASVLVSLAGFALLVLRQPRHRDPTSGDDGARI